MSRRKEPTIPNELLDQLLAGSAASAAFDQGGVLDSRRQDSRSGTVWDGPEQVIAGHSGCRHRNPSPLRGNKPNLRGGKKRGSPKGPSGLRFCPV